MKFERLDSKALREAIVYGVHESGLRVYIVPKKGFCKYYAIYGTEYGSLDEILKNPQTGEETKIPDGVAHFLEHKLFEEEDGGNAFDRFALTGASSNAFTSFDMTAYLYSCTDSFYENLDILLDFVNHPYFTEENVAKEQGIIGQEIKMYEDDPAWRLFFNMLGGMYHNNPVKIDIAGTVESISHITPELLYKCCEVYYNPSNMFLVLVGDVDSERVSECIDRALKDKKIGERPKHPTVSEPETVVKKRVVQKMSVSKPLFLIGFKEKQTELCGRALLKKQIMTQILLEVLFGKSGSFFTELYSEGLIDGSFDKDCEIEKRYGFSSITGESRDPDEVYGRVLKHLESVKQNGICDEDIMRAKRILIGRNLADYNSVEHIGNNFIRAFMNEINPFEFNHVTEEIKKSELEARLCEHFDEAAAVLSVVEPM